MLPSHDCATSLANNLVEYFDNKIELIRSNLEESLNTSYQLSPNAPKFLGVSFEQLSSKDTALQSELKRDFVTPFMNKLILDWKIFKNYRPVSNFSFISKLTERTVCIQVVNHLKENDLYEIFQSAYRQLHSTETISIKCAKSIDIFKKCSKTHLFIFIIIVVVVVVIIIIRQPNQPLYTQRRTIRTTNDDDYWWW